MIVGDKYRPERILGDYEAVVVGSGMGGLATAALLDGTPNPTDEEIVAAMNINICRCNGYTKIMEAVRRAAQLKEGDK